MTMLFFDAFVDGDLGPAPHLVSERDDDDGVYLGRMLVIVFGGGACESHPTYLRSLPANGI